jgi:hypothetical protein
MAAGQRAIRNLAAARAFGRASAHHYRIVTPYTDPDRWTEDEKELFDQGLCSEDIAAGRPCRMPSKPGASFGWCARHEAAMLECHYPDGTNRPVSDGPYSVEVAYNGHTGRWGWYCPEHGASLEDWRSKATARRHADVHVDSVHAVALLEEELPC